MSDENSEQNGVDQQDGFASLVSATESLTNAIEDKSSPLGVEAMAVLNRLRDRRFDVAVVGEFNRGKSTLMNMLVDRYSHESEGGMRRTNKVLPSGALPVTATVTQLSYGEGENARVNFTDGTETIIDLNDLDTYVTEEANPGNKLNVENVEVMLPSPVLRHGAVLVDTPGVGSIFRHNSETARHVIEHADAAIVVLSADNPITEAERSLIKVLSKRSQKTFFVLNRIDHLDEQERAKVTWFVSNVLHEAFGEPQTLWPTSAKTREGFDDFANAVDTFLETQLDDARAALASRDVSTLADKVHNECSLEESALTQSAAEIDDKLGQFRRSVSWQNEAFSDDSVIFRNATMRIRDSLAERLAPLRKVDDDARDRLRAATAEVPTADLQQVIQKTIEDEIHAAVEPIRRREELEVERAWTKAAERFERATDRRAEKLRDIASDLFDVNLKPVETVQPSNQRGRFFYSAPEIKAMTAGGIGQTIASFFMPGLRRKALLETAHQRFEQELARHMDRLRDDLSARVDDADASLEQAMAERVSQLGEAMTAAIERGQSRRSTNEAEQKRQRKQAEKLQKAADEARRVAVAADIRDNAKDASGALSV